MKIGLSTLLFGGYDRDVAIHETARAGYDGIELCSIQGMGEHFVPGMSDWIYEGIKRTLDASGLMLESVGCSGALGGERFEGLMAAAGKLGAPYFTTGSGGETGNEESWAEVMQTMRGLIPICERTGVKLSVKPHVGAAVDSIDTSRRFMEEIDTEWIGLNIDNTHLQRRGDDPAQAVKELAPWIFTGRIRDYKSDGLGIGPVENQIPGKGQSNVKAYWDAFNEHTDLDIVTVEMVGSKDFELDEVVRVVTETIEVLRSY